MKFTCRWKVDQSMMSGVLTWFILLLTGQIALTKHMPKASTRSSLKGTYRYPGNANGALRRPGEIFARGFEYF